MSVQLTPSKRQYDRRNTEPNGKGKWHKSSSFNSQNVPLKVSRGNSVFRVLCLASKIGSVIGKGGSIISQIRQETGAKIRVEETVPGCDERIIFIIGSDKESEVAADRSKENVDQSKEDVDQSKEDVDETKKAAEGDDLNGQTEDVEDKQSIPVEDVQSEKGTSSVQKALLLVFERMVERESETDGADEESDKSSTFVVRLLVLSSQVGCLMGKGGSVIKQMSSDSGAQIRILPGNELPPCASPDDELLQITGEVDMVRKALQSVSQHLLENSPRDQAPFSANPSGPSSHSFGHQFSRPEAYPPANYPFPPQRAPYAPGHMNPFDDILTFRVLCPEEKVGGVIGKGGTIVKSLQHESGCEIKVQDRLSDSDDRIIIISGPAHPDERISAAQDAVLRVLSRIVRATPESKENTVTAKLLVSSHQIGCLLGKAGSVITEMRKLSGAQIRVLGKDQLPKGASGNEEVVQVNGDFERVQDALMHITTRLRDHFFRDAFPSMDHPFPDQPPPFPSYGGRDISPPGMYSNLGPPFHKFDAVGGMPPHGGFQPHDDRPPFMHNMHRQGMPHSILERNPSSAWGPQGLAEGGGPLGMPEFAGAPQRRMGGFGGGSHLAIITNTTVEVVVPRSVVPAIYGEDGGCLKRIREISDAKVTIIDPKPGATETKIIISGTPEQTHAAQSLIQAFVLSETEAS